MQERLRLTRIVLQCRTEVTGSGTLVWLLELANSGIETGLFRRFVKRVADGGTELLIGLFQTPALAQKYAVTVARIGIIRLFVDGAPEILLGLVVLLQAELQQTHDVICLRVVRVDVQRTFQLLLCDIQLIARKVGCAKLGMNLDTLVELYRLLFTFCLGGTTTDQQPGKKQRYCAVRHDGEILRLSRCERGVRS